MSVPGVCHICHLKTQGPGGLAAHKRVVHDISRTGDT